MRSRASGGTCGASVATVTAETKSSLRRRASAITRAKSTWRSSIGGRASARTTAAASVGSNSRRIHASTSRTSARSRNTAARGSAPAESCGVMGMILEAGTSQGYEPLPGRGHGRFYALGMGTDMIDWGAAQRIGELIAGSSGRAGYGGVLASSVEPLARDFAGRVSDYAGLPLPAELPALEVVDRPAWIAANLKTMRPLLDPLTAGMGSSDGITGLLSGPLRSASGFLLGAQVGALTGVLSQRVLGQYDLALLDASVTPRLLLLEPNLVQAARNLGVDRDELVLWVSIHEIPQGRQS